MTRSVVAVDAYKVYLDTGVNDSLYHHDLSR